MGKLATVTRRTFLLGSVAVAGGVAFGFYKYHTPYPNPLTKTNGAVLNPYVIIDQKGVTIIAPRAEMGQGVQSTLAALVAEELDVAWEDIHIIHGPASKAYFNGVLLEALANYPEYDHSESAKRARSATGIMAKFLGLQVTGGSTASKDGFEKMRLAGAAAREVLVQAAAKRWGVSTDMLSTKEGTVIYQDKVLPYAELAEEAAAITPPDKPTLKPKSQWRYIGKPLPRHDIKPKVTGQAAFGIDTQLPDMLYATVVLNPHLGAAMQSFTANEAKAMPGVKDIFAISNAVAVVADNTWRAFQAAKKVQVQWEKATYPDSTEEIFSVIEAAIDTEEPDDKRQNIGDAQTVIDQAQHVVTAIYRAPYLAHATMEPLNCTAKLTDTRLDLWVGHQAPTSLLVIASEMTGLTDEQIHIHIPYLGGGFGRRFETDFVIQAIEIAKKIKGQAVKLTWNRETDTRHDTYRPGGIARCQGVMGSDGTPEAVQLSISVPSVMRSLAKRPGGFPALGPDPTTTEGAVNQPYTIPHYQITGFTPEVSIPIGFWRSVGASLNGFFHECFLDELAHAGKVDPLEMRLKMTQDFTTAHQVLQTLKQVSNWDKPLPSGHARGVAMTLSFGSHCAQVVEVSQTPKGLKVEKVYVVIDAGIALNPDTITAQMESGVIFGLSAAIMGEITFASGKVEQSNFRSYPVLMMEQSPAIEVVILENTPGVQGIGEPGTPPVKAALANAVFALTGTRIREYPLNKQVKFA